MPSHDFRKDGSRTVCKRRLGRSQVWIEESASHVLGYSSSYGLHIVSDRWGTCLNVGAGRFHLVFWTDSLDKNWYPKREQEIA